MDPHLEAVVRLATSIAERDHPRLEGIKAMGERLAVAMDIALELVGERVFDPVQGAFVDPDERKLH
jgi:hypothetical protein